MRGSPWRIDNLSLAVVGILVVAGFIFLDPDSVVRTLIGGALLLVALLVWGLVASSS